MVHRPLYSKETNCLASPRFRLRAEHSLCTCFSQFLTSMLINSRALTRSVRNCVNSCDQTAWKFNVSLRITGYRLTSIRWIDTLHKLRRSSFFEGGGGEGNHSREEAWRELINRGDQSRANVQLSRNKFAHYLSFLRDYSPGRIYPVTLFLGDGNKLAVSERNLKRLPGLPSLVSGMFVARNRRSSGLL